MFRYIASFILAKFYVCADAILQREVNAKIAIWLKIRGRRINKIDSDAKIGHMPELERSLVRNPFGALGCFPGLESRNQITPEVGGDIVRVHFENAMI